MSITRFRSKRARLSNITIYRLFKWIRRSLVTLVVLGCLGMAIKLRVTIGDELTHLAVGVGVQMHDTSLYPKNPYQKIDTTDIKNTLPQVVDYNENSTILLSSIVVTENCMKNISDTTGQQLNYEEHDKSATKDYKLPNLQMIGVQKAGTSAIAGWLFESGVCRPTIFKNEPPFYGKEVHFFDDGRRFSKGIKFYERRFHNCKNHTFIMDATPDSFVHPEKVHAIYDEAGGHQHVKLKIILILRDPVARELSLYNHMLHEYLKTPIRKTWFGSVSSEDGSAYNFDEYVKNVLVPRINNKHWLKTSFYADHLHEWTKYFARDQILVLSYDEIQDEPAQAQDRIRKFVGSDFPGTIQVSNANGSESKVHAMSCSTKTVLNKMFKTKSDELYSFLHQIPGPSMEQRPFHKFQKAVC